MKQPRNHRLFELFSPMTALKIGALSLAILIANLMAGTVKHTIIELAELLMVYLLVWGLGKHLRWLGYFIASLFSLLIVAQEFVRVYGGTYTTKVMLDNLANVHALGAALPKYVTLAIIALVIAFLPVHFRYYPPIKGRIVCFALPFAFYAGITAANKQTAVTGTVTLYQEYQQAAKLARKMAKDHANQAQIVKSFEQSSVKSGINIGNKKYNVITIFAEGTSRATIESTASKYPNLMPNLVAFSKESVNFTNYYNHTAPTYKGLRGQLNSAFQYYEGYEGTPVASAKTIAKRTNTPLISLPTILGNHGYQSAFINPEPGHKQFTPYLNTLGFDKVISGTKKDQVYLSGTHYLRDKANFNLLFDQAEKMSQSRSPFMLGTYTLETHADWKVVDDKYNSGDNAVLNKFHNFDTQFGKFLKRFMASDLKNNTILVVTTDHASYASPDYTSVFGAQAGSFEATIPLMIYYPGVKGQTIDVKGRNSLGLTPTILDLLNISKVKNYFLGTSLFTNDPTPYEYTTEIGKSFWSTQGGTLVPFTSADNKLRNRILKFDSFSLNMQ